MKEKKQHNFKQWIVKVFTPVKDEVSSPVEDKDYDNDTPKVITWMAYRMAPYLLTVLAILFIILFSIPSEVTEMKYFNLTWYTVSFIAAYPLYRLTLHLLKK